jgi:plastocyanin
MHVATLHLVPVLAAEKSKAPFYIAGGALVVWALIISLAVGLRRPDFPGNLQGQRVVMAITAVLVLAAVGTAVITAGTPATAGTAGVSSTQATSSATAPPGASAPAASTPAASTPATGPTASTGAPAPSTSVAPGAVASTLKLAANPAGMLSYDTKQLSAKAGKVTIAFSNPSALEHNVTIAQGSTVLGATPTFLGGVKTLTLVLRPGTYTFYCSVPGHRQAGMEGTLSVS